MGSIPTNLSYSDLLCSIVTPVGMLGYGLNEAELRHGVELGLAKGKPTAIILDSGSTDSGPSKLALSKLSTPRACYVRDLRKLIRAVRDYRVPLLIGSAGGDGTDEHVDEIKDCVSEVLSELNQGDTSVSMKILSIYSNVDHKVVAERLKNNKIEGCGVFVPALTNADIEATTQIVAQMGPEPFISAMEAHPDFDVVIGGRAYDPAPYVAFSAYQAIARSTETSIASLSASILGGFTHMGKIMECGGACATPKSGSALATVFANGVFDVRPLIAGSICTPLSVAAHTLYEKTRPDRLAGPGGIMDLTRAEYESLSDGVSVRVRGAIFESWDQTAQPYTVKLEGAKIEGYRTVFMGSFGDAILIRQLPSYTRRVKEYIKTQHPLNNDKNGDEWWDFDFHIYGFNEKEPTQSAEQVFIVGEALAATQSLATAVAATARVACIHGPYEGQKATSGNFGMGLGGALAFEGGPSAAFSVYHLMELERGEEGAREKKTTGSPELFTWDVISLGSGPRLQELDGTSHPTSIPKGAVDGAQIPSPVKAGEKDQPGAKVQAWTPPQGATLGSLSKIMRSKNSGPYEITMDVMFEEKAVYDWIKASGQLTPNVLAEIYGIAAEDVAYCGYFDQALAFKVTIARIRAGKRAVSGGFMESDVHGSQAYGPLSKLEIQAGHAEEVNGHK